MRSIKDVKLLNTHNPCSALLGSMGYEGWIKNFTHKIGKMNFKNQGKSGEKSLVF